MNIGTVTKTFRASVGFRENGHSDKNFFRASVSFHENRHNDKQVFEQA